MNSLIKNLSYQSTYQVISIVTPLITAPYLSRVLGAKALGIFSYTSSVVAYFVLLAMLGTINYGTKCIAAVKDDKLQLSKVFLSIFTFQQVSSLIAFVAYILYIVLFCKDNITVVLFQALSILECFFDVNWFLFGIENFKNVTIRNMIIKLIEVTLILLFVQDECNLNLYIMILLCGTLLNNLISLYVVRKSISLVHFTISDVISHIKPNIMLFLPLLAISVYHVMDKTMLGLLSDYIECGYYYNSDKLINIPLCVINGVGVVMLPRVASLISKGSHKEVLRILDVSIEMIIAIGVAMAVGIASISNEFIPLFFGKGFERCIFLTYVFAPVLLIKGIVSTVRMQYIVPYGRNKEFLSSVCIGAIVNLILNFMFIPQYAALGAVIGTLGAETAACVGQLYYIRNEINLFKLAKNLIVYSFFGVVLFFVVRGCSMIEAQTILKLILQVLTGTLTYAVMVLVYWLLKKREYLDYFMSDNLKSRCK